MGDAEFKIPDVNNGITTWLSANDDSISQTRVVKRQGLIGEDETTYTSSLWLLEDYTISKKEGGGYKFMITNAFKAMSNATYEDFDGESFSLGVDFKSGDTQVLLKSVSDSLFREPGFLLLVDQKVHQSELIYYTSRSGLTFSGLTRNYFGVGASNLSSKDFLEDDTTVDHVWVKRGSPIDVLMEWLTTSDAVAESPSEKLTNGDLDDWTGGNPDSWEEGGFIDEETTIVHTPGGSSAKFQGNSQLAQIYTKTGFYPNLAVGKGYFMEVWIYVTDAGNASETLRFRVRNITKTKYWDVESQIWRAFTSQWSLVKDVTHFGTWVKHYISFDTDSSFGAGDDYLVHIQLDQQASAIAYVDDASLYGPYDKKPNGPFDQMNGDGVAVPYELINLDKIYEARDTYWPTPTFNASTGNKETGAAVLFVEYEHIDDLKEFAENHIFLPYALKPLVDSQERLVLDRYFNAFPTETTIGDKWRKADFNAAKWRRNFSKVINNFIMLTDFDIERGEHIHSVTIDAEDSINRYGRSKPLELECRGGRSGRLSFPEYDSASDVEVAVSRLALEMTNPWTALEVRVFYEFRDLSLLDAVLMDIANIPDLVNGVMGFTNQRFFVDSKKIDEKKGYVVLTVRLRRDFFRSALIAPAGTLDYDSAARPDDLVYAFVGDSTSPSDPFGDATDFYRVI
jgi:hypothetical protein